MLKYKCLLCGIEWGDPGATELDISHGCCPACIRNQTQAGSTGHNCKQGSLIASTAATMTARKTAVASGPRVRTK